MPDACIKAVLGTASSMSGFAAEAATKPAVPALAAAEEPAALAPSPAAEATVVEEAEGLRLHLSSKCSTGYKGVTYAPQQSSSKPYMCKCTAYGFRAKQMYLGSFATAVEAAVSYARHVLSQQEAMEGEVEAAEVAEEEAAEVVLVDLQGGGRRRAHRRRPRASTAAQTSRAWRLVCRVVRRVVCSCTLTAA